MINGRRAAKMKHEDQKLWDEIDAIKGLPEDRKENAYKILLEMKEGK